MAEQSKAQVAPQGQAMPKGCLMSMSIRDIDGGSFYDKMNAAFADVFSNLHRYATSTGDTRAKAKLKVELTVEMDPDMKDHVDVYYKLKRELPEPTHRSYCKSVGDRLMADATEEAVRARQLEGADEVELFSFMGAPVGTVDTESLVLKDEKDTAGKINPA